MTAFRGILRGLRKAYRQNPALEIPTGIAPFCRKLLNDMEEVLNGVKSIRESLIPTPWYKFSRYITKQRIKWLFKQSRVARLYVYLNTATTLLGVSVGIAIMDMLRSDRSRMRNRMKPCEMILLPVYLARELRKAKGQTFSKNCKKMYLD